MSKEYPEYDWLTGQWYRWETPTSREYEPVYSFVGKPERTEPKQEPPTKTCPLRTHRPKCNEFCVLYTDGRCKVAMEPANNDSERRKCFFDGYTCNSSCGMYNNGCGVVANFERRIKE